MGWTIALGLAAGVALFGAVGAALAGAVWLFDDPKRHIKRLDAFLFDWLFSWRHRRLFRFRIWCRVRWMVLRLWWREPKSGAWRRHWQRPVALLIFGGVVVWLMWQTLGPAQLWQLLHPRQIVPTQGPNDWKDVTPVLQLMLTVLGVPIAFVLWLFRDIHVNETLENQRKDVNLKEFQEIQLRAAGVIDKKFPAQARETLQIAAIHQLRSFLRGDYGESFRRPAWELLRAQLLASSERVDMKAISTRLDERQRGHEENPADPLWSPKNIREIIDKAKGKVGDKLGKDGVARAERAVIREDWARIFRGFRGSLPLIATCFDGIDLPAGALLASRDLSRCTFVGADLRWARLDGANLWGARLDGAILYEARLDGADLSGARLDGANLSGARLDGAILIEARLDGANLSGARLDGADLSGARLDGANLSGARLDGANLFQARLDGAELSWVPLQGAILVEARLDGAVLRWSGLQGADLTGARLDGADLSGARLGGADLSGARLDGADLAVARLDKKTVLAFDWEELSEEERETYRKPWRDAGAIFVQKVTRKNGKVKEVFF